MTFRGKSSGDKERTVFSEDPVEQGAEDITGAVTEDGRVDSIKVASSPTAGASANGPAVYPAEAGREAGHERNPRSRWSSSCGQKLLAGIGIGILVVLLTAGSFAVGYLVGKADNELIERPGVQQPAMPSQPGESRRQPAQPGDGWGAGLGLPGVSGQYQDEIEGELAGKLGISVDDLQKEMDDGKTIAGIAEEKGVSTEELAGAVAAKISGIADKLLADGEISADRAENMKSNAEDVASRMIEGNFRRGRMPGMPGTGGHFNEKTSQ